MPHRIRLSSPWAIRDQTTGGILAARASLPLWGDQYSNSQRKEILCERRFHAPTGLEPATRLELEIPASVGLLSVCLNDECLAPAAEPRVGPLVFSIRDILRSENLLQLVFSCEMNAGLAEPPCLVITEPS